ncbi:MAG: CHAD domain-containing protein [Propionibacteriaceae bacterium]
MTRAIRTLQTANEEPRDLEAITAALSQRFTVVTGPARSVRRARLDTFDHRLSAAGLVLLHQSGRDGDELLLVDGETKLSEPIENLRWPSLADALPAGRVRERAAPVTGIRALIASSPESRRLRRLDLLNEDGKTVARVEVDEPGSPTAGPAQLTVRTLRGYDDQAQLAALILSAAGLRPLRRRAEGKPDSPPEPTITDRRAPAALLLATGLKGVLATMRENLPGLLDDVDTEFLHNFRVAVRRTRSTLKLGRSVLPPAVTARWEPAFKALGDLTTPVRDLDVYELDLPTMTGWLVAAAPADLEPFATFLRTRRAAAREPLVRELRSAGFRRLLTQWGDELDRLTDGSSDPTPETLPAGRWAERSIARAYRRVVRGGAAITIESPAEDLHALRKRCKELRYVIEVCGPVIARGPGKRALAHLKDLQDVLGRFQDCEVQSTALHGFAEAMMADGVPASALLAMGELIAHLEAEQARARRQFAGAFAHFSRPSTRQAMDKLGGTRR